MEQQLAAGLGKGEIAEFIEDDEVDAGEVVGDAALGGTWPELDIALMELDPALGSRLGRPPHPFGDDMSCT